MKGIGIENAGAEWRASASVLLIVAGISGCGGGKAAMADATVGDAMADDAAAVDGTTPSGPPFPTTIRLMNVGSGPVIIQQGGGGPGACTYGFIINGGNLPNARRMADLERPDSICACERCHATASRPLVCESNDPICQEPFSLAPGATWDFPWDGLILFSAAPPAGSDCPVATCDQVAAVPAGSYQFVISLPGADAGAYRSNSDLPAPNGRVVIAVGGP